MALNVEVGDAEARAYASVDEFKAYAGEYGHALTDTEGNAYSDTFIEQNLRQGAILLAGYAPRFPGQRATTTQRLDWPRSGATYRDGSAIDSTSIPALIKDANCEAALYAIANPLDVRTSLTGQRIRKRQAGDVSIEFFEGDTSEAQRTTLTAVEDLLASILLDDSVAETTTKKAKAFLIAGADG